MFWWLTPRPMSERSGNASFSALTAPVIVIGSRAQMLAMPVAPIIVFVADSRSARCTNRSRPATSGSHTAPYPSDSSSTASSWDWAAPTMSSAPVHTPTGAIEKRSIAGAASVIPPDDRRLPRAGDGHGRRVEPLLDPLGRQRAGEVEALGDVATELPQRLEDGLVLDPFGHDPQPEVLGQQDGRL